MQDHLQRVQYFLRSPCVSLSLLTTRLPLQGTRHLYKVYFNPFQRLFGSLRQFIGTLVFIHTKHI